MCSGRPGGTRMTPRKRRKTAMASEHQAVKGELAKVVDASRLDALRKRVAEAQALGEHPAPELAKMPRSDKAAAAPVLPPATVTAASEAALLAATRAADAAEAAEQAMRAAMQAAAAVPPEVPPTVAQAGKAPSKAVA